MKLWKALKINSIKIKKWMWMKKFYFIGAFFIMFIIWLNCTPKNFFDVPTSTILTDTEGNILNARIADDGQWRFPPRKDVPYKFAQAILQFEDRNFNSHWGISFTAFGRAFKQNIAAGRIVSGGSTITMQVVRLSRQGKNRSLTEKLIEVFQATRMEWTYSKEEILAMYASYAPMGGNVVGIDAAAWRYFGRSANNLSWAESCMLAVLPNAPSLLHLNKNRVLLLEKRNRLLNRLYEIKILTKSEWNLAKTESLPSAPPSLPNIAPHVIDKAISKGKKGQWVTSNLSSYIQNETSKIIAYHYDHLKENEIHNAAAVIMEIETGKVVAYVGNTTDPKNENGNHVDVIKAPRSTGSILKPFLYAAMIEDGVITPNQLIEDVPIIISGYAPKNYNNKYDGAVPASSALSRSLNVPIVKMLNAYGIQRFHQKLQDIGMTTINRPSSDYGLSLILGGAEASLWDLCTIYGNMAKTLNDYKKGNTNQFQDFSIYDDVSYRNRQHFPTPYKPAAVWTTFEAMLAVTRPEEDGQWQQFNTSQKIAWKTGTSYGYRDAWAIGVTPRYVVGVWVGNADGEGRPGLVGVQAAAPILFDIFDRLPETEWFSKPFDEMKKIATCKHSGFIASKNCPEVDSSLLSFSCEKATSCPYHKTVHFDRTENYQVNSSCVSADEMISKPWFVLPPIMEKYYRAKNPSYRPLPPFRKDCDFDNNNRPLAIIYPKSQSNIYIPTQLNGTLSKTVFEASHINAGATIFWHLDNLYLGQTIDIHQMELIPKEGRHTLTLVDEMGFEISRTFNVLSE